MPTPSNPEQPFAASTSNAGVLVDLPGVVGVEPTDLTGTLPADAKTNGIKVIVPRWPSFPTGTLIHRVDVHIVGIVPPVAMRNYGAADDAPEFFIPVAPELLPNSPSFEVFYNVRTPNPTTSPSRYLTFPPPVVLKEPTFPDATIFGYIKCSKNNPNDPDALFVWEGIRISIPFDDRFQPFDVIKLNWRGWASLNGSGSPLTPLTMFSAPVTEEDVRDKSRVVIVIEPFIPHIEPMKNNHSALAAYTLVRNGVPTFSSHTGLVKIDRVIPGQSGFCSDANWMK